MVLKTTYNQGVAHDTYYVYDDFGNLTYVLPPKVDTGNGVDAAELSELCYQYKYDYRNRLIEKKIPGKGWEYIMYNKLDQPIMTQDALLRANDAWLFTKYDAFGRVAYTGKIVLPNKTREQLQTEANDFTNTLWVESGNAVMIGGATMYYNNGGYPDVQNAEVLTINYYDDYAFDTAGITNPGTSFAEPISSNTKSLSTGSKVKVLGTSNWITTVNYYDKKGRAIYVTSKNEYLNTTDTIETQLDFVGKVKQTRTTHTKDANAPIVTLDTFTYDHMGRLLTQTQTINTQNPEVIVSNTYDPLGQLGSKKIGGGLQNVDYTYNVRGWLQGINEGTTANRDLFGFKINYNNPTHGATALFNGNISETEWKTANDNTQRWYKYSYDALNRITSGISDNTNYNLGLVTYDKNGNIKELERNGHRDINVTGFGLMDKLAYSYQGNQLLAVDDDPTASAATGFVDGAETAIEYIYDTNGNMTSDANKGITNITYNHLNLPETVTINNAQHTGTISYIYDATGAKIKKVATEGSSLINTEYAGNYVYKNGVLEFFNHPEGIVEHEADGYKYVYQFKDHLGNIRLSYSDKDKDGKIDLEGIGEDLDNDGRAEEHEIVQEKNYYPFGLQHRGYNSTISGRKHNYGYNAKEFDQSLGLNTFDLGARQYDPTIGRFMVVDPMADFINNQSPYSLANNNPVQYVDDYGFGIWNWLKAVGRKVGNGVKKLFSGNQCACSSSGDSLAQAWRRPDNIFPARKKNRRRNNKKQNNSSSSNNTTAVADNSISFDPVSISIPSTVLPQSSLPDIQTPNPRPTTPNITLPGGTPRVIPAGRNISVPTYIQFTGDGTDLAIDAMTKRTLNAIIKTLADYPQIKLEVYVNYTGVNSLRNDPNFEHRARSQSSKRGRKILQFLQRRGIDPSRVRARQGEIIFEKREQSNTRRNSQNFKIINN